MERFTKRLENGRVRFEGNLSPTENALMLPKILERIADYEDTGLEPEEIAKVQAALDTIPFGRFYEIMQAEREGRCVVLPC